MIVGDILVIWRTSAIWFDRKIVVCVPLFWWMLMIGMHYPLALRPLTLCSSTFSQYDCAFFAMPIRHLNDKLHRAMQDDGCVSTGFIYCNQSLSHVSNFVESMVSI